MIIEEDNTLFVHCCKTGGSSIIAGFCHKNDIDMSSINKLPKTIQEKYWLTESWKHAPALKMKKDLGDKFDSYYKFSMIRNPWDRFMSSMNWLFKPNGKAGLKDFRDKFRDTTMSFWDDRTRYHRTYWSLTYMICDQNDNMLVDEVFDLKDINVVRNKFKLKDLDRKRVHSQNSFKLFDEYDYIKLDDIVTRVYKKDIEIFQYDRSDWMKEHIDDSLRLVR